MPLTRYNKAREERRLIVFLYMGTLVLLSILLYATWKNMSGYQRSTEAIRRHNLSIIELDGVMGSLRDQETDARGFLLSGDSTYLEPFRRSESEYLVYLAVLDSMYVGEEKLAVDSLRVLADSVRAYMTGLVIATDTVFKARPEDAARLKRAKGVMDRTRGVHGRLVARIRAEREALLAAERSTGVQAPAMIIVYSALALAATALLFWRLFRSLNKNERMNLELNLKVRDLDQEVIVRRRVQGLLEKVQDTSPNGIMSFATVRDESQRIVDFTFVSSNRMANSLVKRSDLIGKQLLVEMPENRSAGLFDSYVQVVETGRPHKRELHYEGEGMDFWVSVHAVKLDDGFMVTFTDISDQKRAHELSVEADRVALTGQITRTVAHEVRNPLTNIHLALEQLHDEVVDRDEVTQPFFGIIHRNLERIGTLIREMLESSKKRDLVLKPCRLKDIADRATTRVSDRLGLKAMRHTVDIQDGLPEVMADRDLIELAITNIAVNAIEAMEPGKGELRISARRTGDEVVMEIADNGKGIPPENITRLFEPFYSGRPGGLGLGLTTTRSILNSHGIGLDVRSTVGRGTTFTLRFQAKQLMPAN
ncbi:MAG: CHASE3 domain-containing protein [Flavobacteriales bacterium]|nr:CHASE3 domain-containing protein [Flavobacteriales bacterium]